MRVGVRKVFPNSPQDKKNRGPRPVWTYRPTHELRDYIEDRIEHGHEKTEVAVGLMEVALHLIRELGDDYYEVERRAKVDEVATGTVLARLVREGMKHSKK